MAEYIEHDKLMRHFERLFTQSDNLNCLMKETGKSAACSPLKKKKCKIETFSPNLSAV